MSKTTFQIPMCVLVPILSARLNVCVYVTEERWGEGTEEECKVTNVCGKNKKRCFFLYLVFIFLNCPAGLRDNAGRAHSYLSA